MTLQQVFNIDDLSQLAHRRLPPIVFDYLAGGAEDESTLRSTRAAFERYRFVPRVLPGEPVNDLSVEVFGQRLQAPFVVGPTGLNGIFWHQADLALASAARRAGTAFVLSSAANVSLEAAAEHLARQSPAGLGWFQLYAWGRPEVATALLRRAWAAGYRVLVVTVDALVAGKRERDLRNHFAHELRLTPRAIWQGLSHPHWLARTWLAGGGMPRFENVAPFVHERAKASELADFIRSGKNPALSWDDMARLRELWPGAMAIKGILAVPDAERAARLGADGIVISNHGGRQLDGAVDTLWALERIAGQVDPRLALLVDGGLRRGADVVRALALGATAVVLGRAPLYGVAAAGEEGASRALEILREETARTLGLLGCPSIGRLSREFLTGLAS